MLFISFSLKERAVVTGIYLGHCGQRGTKLSLTAECYFASAVYWGSPRGYKEQGNMAITLLATREQKENKAENMGTKAVFLIF